MAAPAYHQPSRNQFRLCPARIARRGITHWKLLTRSCFRCDSTSCAMMGVSPEQAARFMVDEGADVIGLNCGTGIDMIKAADTVARFRSVSELPIIAQPNAGEPALENMKVVYRQSPAEMAAGIRQMVAARAGIVGGCCGSTPGHIRELRRALDRGVRQVVQPQAGE